MKTPRLMHQKWLLPTLILSCAACALLFTYLSPLETTTKAAGVDSMTDKTPPGPPWLYGSADAQFTIVLYADFACPYCRAYFPALKEWIAAHPETNLQWHHLPASGTRPDSLQSARVAECAGETGGNTAFWSMVSSIYEGTQGNDASIEATEACLSSARPDAAIQAQAATAATEGITATPSLKAVDRLTGKSLVLLGPTSGDALLSAMDLLTAPATTDQPSDSH